MTNNVLPRCKLLTSKVLLDMSKEEKLLKTFFSFFHQLGVKVVQDRIVGEFFKIFFDNFPPRFRGNETFFA